MSREIKFRAWDLKEKVMREVNEIAFTIGSITCKPLEGHDKTWEMYDPICFEGCYEIMQYTGLKDKNGVEIYEHSELDGAYEVIFKDLRYSLRHINNNDIIDLYDYWRDKNGEVEVTREYTKV